MDAKTFVLGFALIVVGVFVSFLVKQRGGWTIISAMTAVIGIFGFGYSWGHGAALEDTRHLLRTWLDSRPPELPLEARLAINQLPVETFTLRLDFWFGLVSICMAIGGSIALAYLLQNHLEAAKRDAR